MNLNKVSLTFFQFAVHSDLVHPCFHREPDSFVCKTALKHAWPVKC